MTGLEVAALAVAVVGTGASMYEQHKAQGYQKQATRAARLQNDLQAARQRRDAIRQARIAQGQLGVKGATQGVQNSSAFQGGLGSIQSQLNNNLSFLDVYNNLSNEASLALDKAASAQGLASDFGKVADLGMTVFGNSSHISKVFSPRASGG